MSYRKDFPLPNYRDNELWFNMHNADDPAQLPAIAATGAKGIRTDISFKWLRERAEQGLDPYLWYDRLIDKCDELGLRVIFIVSYIDPVTMMTDEMNAKLSQLQISNWWNASYNTRLAPIGLAQDVWMAKAKEIASRYQKRGVIWDIWNEPNWTGNFITLDTPLGGEAVNRPGSEVKCQQYVDFIQRASETIRSVHKYEWIAINTANADLQWWTAICDRGILEHIDMALPHTYTASFFNELPNRWDGHAQMACGGLAGITEIISNFKTKSIAIGVGEWGFPASGSIPPTIYTQKDYHKAMKFAGDKTQIRMTVVYNWGNSHLKYEVPGDPLYWQEVWGTTPVVIKPPVTDPVPPPVEVTPPVLDSDPAPTGTTDPAPGGPTGPSGGTASIPAGHQPIIIEPNPDIKPNPDISG